MRRDTNKLNDVLSDIKRQYTSVNQSTARASTLRCMPPIEEPTYSTEHLQEVEKCAAKLREVRRRRDSAKRFQRLFESSDKDSYIQFLQNGI